jgi:ZIP family zinc transporter
MPTVSALLLSVAAFFSTLAGGLLALRLARYLTFILAFTAGVLLGVVAFDVIPEAFNLARAHAIDPTVAMLALVLGFLLFHSLEKFLLLHHAHEADYASHHHPRVGALSALALAGHSFMDGVGIGLAFQLSNTAGVTVAIAVITHDFCDGLNTFSLMLVHRNTERRSLAMLILDAAAPVLGAASTLLFHAPPAFSVAYLGFFAGFLLYIGASDILPEAHSRAAPRTTVVLIGFTTLGAALIFLAIRIAG